GRVRGGARAAASARALRRLDPDGGGLCALHVVPRDLPDPLGARRGGVRVVGLAGAVPDLDRVARGLALDQAHARRVADVPEDDRGGPELQAAAARGVPRMAEPEARARGAVRAHVRARRAVLHGALLLAVLPDAD